MADWEMFAGDLFPPLPLILTDSNGPIDLTDATSVRLLAASSTYEITGGCSILQVAFTGDLTSGSADITSVSSSAGLWLPGTAPWSSGSTLFAPGYIPAPAGTVGNWTLPTVVSISGTTITMDTEALESGTGVSIIGNIGVCKYVWASGDTANAGSYSGVTQITWPTSLVQTVPNSSTVEWTLQIDPLPAP